MTSSDRYCGIGEELFREVLDLLVQGKQIALLGPKCSGKSLLLEEIESRSRQLPQANRPHIIKLDSHFLCKLDEDDLLVAVRELLGPWQDHKVYLQETLSGKIAAILEDKIIQFRRPVWVLMNDILGFAAPIAREFLYALASCHFNDTIRGRLGVVVAGSCDFVPLTYGSVSPYRHAEKFLVTGLSVEYARRFFCVLRQRQRGENRSIRDVTAQDIKDEITEDAFEHLYEATGGQLHLLRQTVLTSASPTLLLLNKVPPACMWTRRVVEDCISQFIETHMPNDLHCRATLRNIEREPESFDLLLKVLSESAERTILGGQPNTLEVSGLVLRKQNGKGVISCELWRQFLENHLNDKHIADVYVWQRRWANAWMAFERLPRHERPRPIAGEAAVRLRSSLFAWEDSLYDYVDQGPPAVWKHFCRGVGALLGFDGWGLFDKQGQQLVPIYAEDTVVSERGVLGPGTDAIRIYREMPKQSDVTGHRKIKSGEYWLDCERMRLLCDPQVEVLTPTIIRPVLFLERRGYGNEIDTTIQRYLWPAVDRFWYAFVTACDIEYRKGLGELRERHLRIIEYVNRLLPKEPFDMGKMVQGAVDAIVTVGNYYRAQICLVDPKREYIQAIASACQEPEKNINFATNIPLESPEPIEEWDAHAFVVRNRETVVVSDASNPIQAGPNIQHDEAARLGIAAVSIVPMSIRDEVIGTIHFERLPKDVPSGPEVELYEVLAGQLAVALYQAQKITLLQESLKALPDRIRIVAPDRTCVFLNWQVGWQLDKRKCYCQRHGEASGDECLINEVQDSNKPAHHYSIQCTSDGRTRAQDWLLVPIDDFRAHLPPPFHGANPRIGYIERVHDLTELYQLHDTVQTWFAEKGVRATAQRILDFFCQHGFTWARIYIIHQAANGKRRLDSLAEFGLQDIQHQERFLQGEIQFYEDDFDPQPWHVLTVARAPSVYEYRDLQRKRHIEAAQALHGLPRFWTSPPQHHHLLETQSTERWIESPLFVGEEPIGKISMSIPPELLPEKWELLRSAMLSAAAALNNAKRSEDERMTIEANWRKAAASFSHRIGNTLPVAQYRLQRIVEDASANQVLRDNARVISDSVNAALRIAMTYRGFAKKAPVEMCRCTVGELIDGIVTFCEKTRDTRLAVAYANADIAGVSVTADQSALGDVFVGLVSDSVRFHLHNSPSIRLNIDVEKTVTPMLMITYCDDGPGVQPDLKERIFEPFFSTHGEGMGIGLADARQVIDSHNGSIIENGLCGQGIRFEIRIPLNSH